MVNPESINGRWLGVPPWLFVTPKSWVYIIVYSFQAFQMTDFPNIVPGIHCVGLMVDKYRTTCFFYRWTWWCPVLSHCPNHLYSFFILEFICILDAFPKHVPYSLKGWFSNVGFTQWLKPRGNIWQVTMASGESHINSDKKRGSAVYLVEPRMLSMVANETHY